MKHWVQKDGSRIEIREMTDRHLLNTLKMLKRNNRHRSQTQWISSEYLPYENFNPDSMAAYYFGQFADNALAEGGFETTIPPSLYWQPLLKEAKRRKLNLKILD